jgi:pyruvate dehydrogenase E2 component (dihydrolipoamide acetyltransferase)
MASEVLMPQMGFDMAEGTVVRWLKKEGDEVKRGEVIAEIETDKATIEMEADASGLLRSIVVGEGSTVPVGQVIAYIGAADETLPDASSGAPAAKPPSAEAPSAESKDEPVPAASASTKAAKAGDAPKVSPVARRIAEEQGIDVAQVQGTGPGGRITREDVLAFAKQGTGPAPVSGEVQRIALSRMAQAIARHTQQAKGEIPHYYVTAGIDMTRAMDMRKQLNSDPDSDLHVSVNDIIIKACAVALVKFPVFNAVFKGDHLEVAAHVNIGIAIALPEGLIVPALLECERKSLDEIARESKDLGERTRAGRLRQEEYTGGTFSISNLGMFDIDSFAAIINASQSAVLAVGAVRYLPVVEHGEIVVREVMQATLSSDHRVTNGADAARFLGEIKRLLESSVLLAG